MKPVTLAVFNSREEAEPVRQRLCDAGIWAELRLENDPNRLLEFGRPATGVKIEVPREDFEDALHVIYDWNNPDNEGQSATWLPWTVGQAPSSKARSEDSG